ncbi:MAG: DUF1572 domain-containing protein [Aureispira sp.]|nr:DUF1572 domain-containing protein [Aureispira sp.]
MSVNLNYLQSARTLFQYYKDLGSKAINQLSEDQIHWQANSSSNNIAVVVKHIVGNMLSRWTNFLTEDGEKSWRHRETEFEHSIKDKKELLATWEKGWQCLFDAINPLKADDLDKIIYIRNEGHTVLEAMNRQLAHYAYHVGQLVFLAKQICAEDWQSLSIPKGQSKAFNQEKFAQDKDRKHFI